ncbi:transmembrane protein 187 [Callorhinchus milii]|uniref:Transmembrane protein 187 n=1 Tax=Callorhinchus milii TaxID=7868 RepID=A0A4W3GY61_CALMI|nr:transmembrane protein 187 [Callorhinchus milii]|eukprot:gi/632985797/ref/XP_007909883.1/ PREDICTED: transmembrane protein 187 [Callorhinchus milii]
MSARRLALCHVLLGAAACVAAVWSGVFDGVQTELGLESYAERQVAWMPRGLTLPGNALVNLGYVALGWHWLRRGEEAAGGRHGRYVSHVFGWMVAGYGLVQAARIASQRHPAAVLDQWFTLPIFAWVPVWCLFLLQGWRPGLWRAIEAASLGSYLLALAVPQGFELALACHVALAIVVGVGVQWRVGDGVSRRWLLLAITSCAGFVGLKLLDAWLGQWQLFHRLSGHFWSKVCDVLQIHFSFLFLTHLTHQTIKGKGEKQQ